MARNILVCSLIFLLAACAKPVTQAPQYTQQDIQMETAVQKQLIEQGERIRKTPFTQAELQNMSNRLKAHATRITQAGQNLCRNMGRDPKSCTYSFALRKDDNLNAYADGKGIYVTAQMMRFAQDDDMLGMVLSHEYAHNIMGHIDAKKQNIMAGMLLGAAVDAIAKTGGQFSKLGAQGGSRAFSPDFENEADYVGLYVMALAGYDIAKAGDLWRHMSVADPRGAFLTGTHPANPQRYVVINHTKNEIVNKVRNNVLLTPNIRIQ